MITITGVYDLKQMDSLPIFSYYQFIGYQLQTLSNRSHPGGDTLSAIPGNNLCTQL